MDLYSSLFYFINLLIPHFLYILYSVSTDHYYIGRCSAIEVRLIGHNAGTTPSTKHGRPWKVVYSESLADKTEDLKSEQYLKKLKSRQYIETLLSFSMAR